MSLQMEAFLDEMNDKMDKHIMDIRECIESFRASTSTSTAVRFAAPLRVASFSAQRSVLI